MNGIDSTVVWIAIVGSSIATYALRVSFMIGIERLGELPPAAKTVLPFVPIAVLAALIAPDLVYVDGAIAIRPGNERLVAGTIAIAVAWRTESMLATVGVGMVALWILQWL